MRNKASEPSSRPNSRDPQHSAPHDLPGENTFIARQPILDRKLRVFGYEILFRANPDDPESHIVDGDSATLSVIQNLLMLSGTDSFTGGAKAFVNFTQNLLLQEAPFYLPREWAVIEILESVEPLPEVVEACRRLKQEGYTLALDDFVLDNVQHLPLLPLTDILKVDVRLTAPEERRHIIKRFGDRVGRFLAEKTETRQEFQEALEAGFSLFQGYFFSRPVIIARKDIPVYKVNALRLIQQLNRPDLDMDALEKVIKQDPALVYKLLRYVNSAFFAFRHKVGSVRHAVALLGERELRKWATLSVYTRLTTKDPQELLRLSLVRARFLELLAPLVGMAKEADQLFLMGIFSVVDTLLGRPMAEALEDVPLEDEIKDALLGTLNRYRVLYEVVLGYEKAHWEAVSRICSGLKIEPGVLTSRYLEAIDWTEQVHRLR
ncbi:EAL and modified HD-GYP domain-containing signal transduction protein [Desulfacinum hydrothermale DSM 13146]|uniref:EAL and modified HD-GYP domain-containing signal transduction protein n=1 Tax=Desulfacinum hydrothermale DSM 13146 TaxID=1121390 RepID=A0A1W1X924_9BACT|nr:HDOD domain-containing protein [Desulfacinum hydrothermale]SMC20327.1 EAL and modified HD-GYP domain-containing signal transduction protein [Desulfacinum hydrothermale DSM 13146]